MTPIYYYETILPSDLPLKEIMIKGQRVCINIDFNKRSYKLLKILKIETLRTVKKECEYKLVKRNIYYKRDTMINK